MPISVNKTNRLKPAAEIKDFEMTNAEQRAELHRKIWRIANEVRGAVDGWDFKQYVLGALFYRFISENFLRYMEADDETIRYSEMADNEIPEEIQRDTAKTKGYFILPSQLFCNVAKNAGKNENLNVELPAIFTQIENSSTDLPSERNVKGLFGDFVTNSDRLGNTVKEKNARLTAVLKGIEDLKFGDFHDSKIDVFGDAYEFLISNYAANAGKSGGEFFTPQTVSRLIAQIALHKQKRVNKIYDIACGSGGLARKKWRAISLNDVRKDRYDQYKETCRWQTCQIFR